MWKYLLAGASLTFPSLANAQESTSAGDDRKAGEEIVVTAQRTPTPVLETPFSVSVVDREDIDLVGATRLEDALRSVPGLQFGTQGNAYPRIATRGFRDTADVLVLVDGVPFRQLNGSADLIMLPVGIIDRIEFVKGPGSATYGRGAIGGVMQIFTQSSSDAPTADVQMLGGSYDHAELRVRAGAPIGTGAFDMQAGVSTDGGFQDRAGRDGQYISGGIRQEIGDNLRVRINGAFSDVQSFRGSIIPLIDGKPAYGVDRKVNYGIPGAQIHGKYGSISGTVEWSLGGLTISNLLNWSRYDRYATGGITIVPAPTASSRGWSESNTRQDIWYDELTANWTGRLGAGELTLVAGGSYESGDLGQTSYPRSNAPTYRAPDFDTPVSNAGNDPKGVPGTPTLTDASMNVASLFFSASYKLGPLGVVAGARWDAFDQRLDASNVTITARQKANKATVRLGADYAFIDNDHTTLSLFGNYSEGFKPQFVAFSTSGGVTLPNLLRPEFVESREVGLKASLFGGRAFVQTSYFDINRKDAQRSFRTGPDTFIFQNASQRVKGVEFEARGKLVHGFDAYVTYAHHNPRNTSFITTAGDFSGGQIRMQAREYFGGGATFRAGPLTLNSSLNYVSKRPLRDNVPLGTSQILPSYTVWNGSARWTFGKHWLQVAVNNITDKFYISDDFSSQNAGNAGVPRTVLASLGMHF